MSVDIPSAPPTEAPLAETAPPAAGKPRGRPFERGQSGNPNGRPKGSANRATQLIEALIHGQSEALGAKALEKALEGDGDSIMLRALLRTLVPTRRERTVEFDLPKIETVADAVNASSAVLTACAAGQLSPSEATEIAELISTHVRTMEIKEFEERLTALERNQTEMMKLISAHMERVKVLALEERVSNLEEVRDENLCQSGSSRMTS
jgi:Family of unknown function (DUF5681)